MQESKQKVANVISNDIVANLLDVSGPFKLP